MDDHMRVDDEIAPLRARVEVLEGALGKCRSMAVAVNESGAIQGPDLVSVIVAALAGGGKEGGDGSPE